MSKLGQRGEALKSYRQARDIGIKLANANPKVPSYQNSLAHTRYNLGKLLAEMDQREEALKEYQQARDVAAGLVKTSPEVLESRLVLAGTCSNMGTLFKDLGKSSESLDHYGRAIEVLQPLRRQQSVHPIARIFLLNSYWERAPVLEQLGRHREAVADWDQAARLDAGPNRNLLRLMHARALAHAGDRAEAVRRVKRIESLPHLTAGDVYSLASVYAVFAGTVARDTARPLPERDKLAEQYARKAVALLWRANAAGWFREKAKVVAMEKEADFTLLRTREDWKRFRARVKVVKWDWDFSGVRLLLQIVEELARGTARDGMGR